MAPAAQCLLQIALLAFPADTTTSWLVEVSAANRGGRSVLWGSDLERRREFGGRVAADPHVERRGVGTQSRVAALQ